MRCLTDVPQIITGVTIVPTVRATVRSPYAGSRRFRLVNDTAPLLLAVPIDALPRRAGVVAFLGLQIGFVEVLLQLDVAQPAVHHLDQILMDTAIVLLDNGQLPPATTRGHFVRADLFHLSGIFGVGGRRSLKVALVPGVMLLVRMLLLLLLLLLRLGVRQALLVAEQLPLQAVVLRLQGSDLPPHLLIVNAANVVVLVIGRLE